jgi:hypothetical protein
MAKNDEITVMFPGQTRHEWPAEQFLDRVRETLDPDDEVVVIVNKRAPGNPIFHRHCNVDRALVLCVIGAEHARAMTVADMIGDPNDGPPEDKVS